MATCDAAYTVDISAGEASDGVGPLPVTPRLDLVDANGNTVASNNDWKSDQQQEIEQTDLAPSNDREAAIVAQVPSGPIMAHLRGNDNSSGIGLVEIYALPEQNGVRR